MQDKKLYPGQVEKSLLKSKFSFSYLKLQSFFLLSQFMNISFFLRYLIELHLKREKNGLLIQLILHEKIGIWSINIKKSFRSCYQKYKLLSNQRTKLVWRWFYPSRFCKFSTRSIHITHLFNGLKANCIVYLHHKEKMQPSYQQIRSNENDKNKWTFVAPNKSGN